MGIRKSVDYVQVRLVKDHKLFSEDSITCARDAVRLVGEDLKEFANEAMITLNLNSKGKVENVCVVSVGDLNSSLVHPREMFKPAILSNAASILIMHNHPSGVLTPSDQDLEVTERLIAAGDILGIKVIDHVIVGAGNDDYFAFSSQGLMYELNEKAKERVKGVTEEL